MNNEIKNEKEREVHIEQSAKKEDVLSEQERDKKLAETLARKKPPAESDSDQGEKKADEPPKTDDPEGQEQPPNNPEGESTLVEANEADIAKKLAEQKPPKPTETVVHTEQTEAKGEDKPSDVEKYVEQKHESTKVIETKDLKSLDYAESNMNLHNLIEKDAYSVIDTESDAQANEDWAKMGYTESPVASETSVFNVKAGDFHYVRTFSSDWDNYNGKWIMRYDDIAGLSATEIAEKYAMPSVPDMICDVQLPQNTPLEVSVAGPQKQWGNSEGGNIQYAIKDVETEETWFINKRNIMEENQ